MLLARAHLDGTLELLWPGMPAASAAVAILDEQNMGPVDLKMRCRDGRGKGFRLYRRFDPYERRMYVVAVETPDG